MAKLTEVPNREVIDLLRGNIDFAVYKGQAYARSFPKKPKQPRSTAVISTQNRFRYSSKMFVNCSEEIRTKWHDCLTGRGWHWKDVATVAYYGLNYYADAPLFMLLAHSTKVNSGQWYCNVKTDIENQLTLNYSQAKPFYMELKRLLRGVIQTYASVPAIITEGSVSQLSEEPTKEHTFKIPITDMPNPFNYNFTGTLNNQQSPSITPVFSV